MTIRVEPGDCLEVIPRLVAEGVVVDAVVTDPPYHLTDHKNKFIGRCAERVNGVGDWNQGAMGRLARGFMNQIWDGGDVAFRPETWATVATVLRPGGFLLAFGGPRTAHRMVCAIEDAGFVIQDTIMWLYGSGFPKRRDALKPAFEPVCVAYKPGGKRTLQVDECRIGTGEDKGIWPITDRRHNDIVYSLAPITETDLTKGRWPANVCHSGDDEVMEAFAAFGEKHSGDATTINSSGYDGLAGGLAFARAPTSKSYRGPNAGSAARFFYCAKADADDRFGSRHPTVKPVELLKWLVPLVTPKGGLVLDCFAGSGTTGIAALATGRNAILIEREDSYIADIRERLAHYEGEGRHSLAARNRNGKPKEALPLFAEVSE